MDENQAGVPTPQKPPRVREPGSGRGGLIVIAVIVLLVIGAGAVIALDLFGFREQTIMPRLRTIPIVGNLFPEEEDPDEEIPFGELQNRYQAAMIQIESLQNQNAMLGEEINAALLRIADLVRFEERWHEYRIARAQMDQYIAHGDPINFVEFFANVSEENIPELYTQAEQLIEFERRTMMMVRTMNSLEEASAGQILSDLLLRETELMLRVLGRMSPGRIAEVMETIDDDVRTTIFILMSPEVLMFDPLFPDFPPFPPYLPELPALYALPPATPATIADQPPAEPEPETETEPETEETPIEEPAPDAITNGTAPDPEPEPEETPEPEEEPDPETD